MVLRLYVHIDETQSLFLAFDLYIIYVCGHSPIATSMN